MKESLSRLIKLQKIDTQLMEIEEQKGDLPSAVERLTRDADQLSEKYGQIEIFRIRALLLNLEEGTFRGEQRELAARELVRKCRIYAAGCEKRGKEEEAQRYKEMARRYQG